MMRVLVISTWYPYPPDNGSKIRAYYLVRALSERHAVTVIAFRPPAGQSNAMTNAEVDRITVVPVEVDPFRHVNAPQLVKYASPIPLAFWPSRAMQHAVSVVGRGPAWDAVVAIQTPVAQYAAHFRSARRVLDVDTSFSYQLARRHAETAELRTWLSWQKTHRYETRMLRQFHACTVVSSQEVAFVQSMIAGTAGQVEVLTNGVDCEQHRPGMFPVRPNSLIYNGALTYRANYDAMRYFLSDIYPGLRARLPDITLTITGAMTGVNQSGLRLDSSVQLSGYVPNIQSMVGSSAVCVIPIRQGSGTRLKILEAMALGVPVVSTTKGAEGLSVLNGEHLLIADEPQDFANKICAALKDAALRARLTANARQLVETKYDWRAIGQDFAKLVESV